MRPILTFFALLAVLANLVNATSSCHMLQSGQPELSGLAALQVVCVTHLGEEPAEDEPSDSAAVDLCCHQLQNHSIAFSLLNPHWEWLELPTKAVVYPAAQVLPSSASRSFRLPPRAPPLQA
ncbi:MAG: hypothetical protein RRB13_15090 [bacterium]|nr:hypothetical protein [bacterium]